MSEETTDEKLDRGAEAYKKKHPELNIKIDTTNMAKVIELLKEKELENKELSEQLENEKTEKEDYESKLKIVAEQKLSEKRSKILKLGYKGNLDSLEAVISAEEHLGLRDNSDKGAGGVVGLRGEDVAKEHYGSGQKSFNSHKELIDFLRSESLKGNVEAQENLKKLWEKVVKGMHESPEKVLNFTYKDTFEPNPETGEPESCIKRHIRQQNERLREKRKGV